MNKILFNIIISGMFGLLIASCSDSADLNKPIGEAVVPMQVSNVQVKNLPGRAVIRYSMPDDDNLKYIRARYNPNDEEKDVNASFYVDSLVVEGFPEAKEYEVKLYSVSYGDVASEPVTVKVHPQTPPYIEVGKTIEPHVFFGGLRVGFENVEKAKVGIGVMKKQANGQWTQIHMHYTEAGKGQFYVYGQESIETEFALFVRDRWGHVSETTYFTETPWFEEQCDKNLFRKMALPSDTYECHSWNEITKGNDMTRLWDNVVDADPCFQTKTTSGMPQWFTFDLGRTYNLSRFIMISRYYAGKWGNVFKMGHPKKFEIWGSTNPNENGTFDESWVKLSDYESVKPSGGGVNDALTAEDQEMGKNGETFLIPEGSPPVRYIRFKTNETWSKTAYMHLHELTFFGSRIE